MERIDRTKPGRLYSKLANLYFRFGGLLLAAVTAVFGVVMAQHMDWAKHKVQHWVVTKGFGRGRQFTTFDNSEGFNIFILALIFGLMVGLIVYAIKTDQIVDMEQNGKRFRYASAWRKFVFCVSLFLGFTGLDRLIMRCYWIGLLKSLLFLVLSLVVFEQLDNLRMESMLYISVPLATAVYWWGVDLILIHSGTAEYKTDSCRYQKGSGKRKLARIISVVFGYTGIDRLMMTRPAYGLLKLLFFLPLIGALEDMGRARVDHFMVIFFIYFAVMSLVSWIMDAWAVNTGDTRATSKDFLW